MTGAEKMPLDPAECGAGADERGYNEPRMAPPLTLGHVFRLHREAKGRAWTQRFLAQRAGLHLSTIVKVEKDHPSVTDETKARVAGALGTTLDELKSQVSYVDTPSAQESRRTHDLGDVPHIPFGVSGAAGEGFDVMEADLSTLTFYARLLDVGEREALVDQAITMYRRSRSQRGARSPAKKAQG